MAGMQSPLPPDPTFFRVELANTTLQCVRCGSGPPLIIVPATVSLIRQWLPLAQFMGLHFTSYFFELPGHGGSTAYPQTFESSLVPRTVEALVDQLGIARFNLMGFSFGGLLAMRTLDHLHARIDNLILISPAISKRALKFPTPQQLALRGLSEALKRQRLRQIAYQILHQQRLERPLMYAISKVGGIDRQILAGKDALKMPESTLDVLAHTLGEILEQEYRSAHLPFSIPCQFAMSIYDDLLDYQVTEEIVRQHFTNLTVQQLTLPYHQPPDPPTFDWLLREFGGFLEQLKLLHALQPVSMLGSPPAEQPVRRF